MKNRKDLVNFILSVLNKNTDGNFNFRQEGVDVLINDIKVGVVYFEESSEDEEVMMNKFDIILPNGKMYSFEEEYSDLGEFTVEQFVYDIIYDDILM